MPPITRTPRYDTVDSGPHAATVADGFDYTYDDVGNLTVADDSTNTYTYTYDVRNQLIAVDLPGTDDLTMVYDTDGSRVSRAEGAITVTYIGGLYEITKVGSSVTTRTHYMFAGDMVGTRVDDGTTDTITYTFGDHLGSVTAAYTPPQNGNGDGLQTQYYKPYGEPRGTTATLPSDHTYTGQIDDPGVLMYYNARYYQPSIGRFTQPDSIIPDPGNGQDHNRYMYVRGNPVKTSDPGGHAPVVRSMPILAGNRDASACNQQDFGVCFEINNDIERASHLVGRGIRDKVQPIEDALTAAGGAIEDSLDWLEGASIEVLTVAGKIPEVSAACFFDPNTCGSNVLNFIAPVVMALAPAAATYGVVLACAAGPVGCAAGAWMAGPALGGWGVVGWQAYERWFSPDRDQYYEPLKAPWRGDD